MSLLNRINRSHFAAQQKLAGEVVTLRRGSKRVEVTAVRGHTTLQDTGADGDAIIEVAAVDFQFRSDDYDFGSGEVEPRRGDEITAADGDVFDLLPGNAGESWRYMDHEQTLIRVHTVRRVKS